MRKTNMLVHIYCLKNTRVDWNICFVECIVCVLFVQSSREEQLQQKLLEEQFSLLQATVTEAENIIQDAVTKLDDPLHVRCTSSPGNVTLFISLTLKMILLS